MPDLPPGEHDLEQLALAFTKAEVFIATTFAMAANGDRGEAAKRALSTLAALRLHDFKSPVVVAYLHEHPMGRPDAVRDLAGLLARKLDNAAQTAADGVRDTIRKVTVETLDELSVTTAAVDAAGHRWGLGAWARMQTETVGRIATSRGLSDRVGEGGVVTVHTGSCSYCSDFGGQAIIGESPLPPFHPSCTCVATAD
jgi:hypothetical protein